MKTLAVMLASPQRRLLAVQPPLAVVYRSGPEAFAEVVDGVRTALSKDAETTLWLDLNDSATAARISNACSTGNSRAVLAIGDEALRQVRSCRGGPGVYAALVLQRQLAAGSDAARLEGCICLDIPVAQALQEVMALFPKRARVGVIRNPERSGREEQEVEAKARQLGLTASVAECSRPDQLLAAFLSLRGRADFVLLFPDPVLYTSATVRPLILASLENRVPVIGFSPTFVRAGAAAGVYADFREVGQQAADLVRRPAPASFCVPPRKLQVAVNQRVLRLLGLQSQATERSHIVAFR